MERNESVSLQNLLKKLVFGFVVWHPVVDLYGIHDKDVADDGDDELRDPIGVTGGQKTCADRYEVFLITHTVYLVKLLKKKQNISDMG